MPGDVRLICLFGPTGIGKTTLIDRVKQRILEQEQTLMAEDPGYMPIAKVDAVAPDSGNFNWRDYYKRALEVLNDPFYGQPRINFGQGVRWSGPEMRRALEKALQLRQARIFIIDEAQHLTKMASGRKLQDQMDSIKSLAGVTGTAHVLAGTYELMRFRNLSGQLIRRSQDIHFRRYLFKQEEDKQAWHAIVWAFERHLPLEKAPDLLGHLEFCFERSVGCVGLLKEWLLRALRIALEMGLRTIDSDLLKRTAFSASQCQKIIDEIRTWEKKLEENDELRDNLRAALGLANAADHQEVEVGKKKGKKGAPGRVGQRLPARDPVGIRHHAGGSS
jgi:hypothetical protein